MIQSVNTIKNMIANHKSDGIATRVSHNEKLWQDVLTFTNNISFKNKAERIYYFIQQYANKPTCPCGNSLTFLSIISGYRTYCRASCIFAKQAATINRVATMEKNGGVGLANPKSLKKAKQTNLKRYGVSNPFATEENIENNRINNCMFDPEIVQKIRDNCLEQYNVDWHSKRQDVIDKTIDSNMKKYGVSNTSQKDYSDETKRILWDPIELEKLFKVSNIQSMAEQLNVSEKTILNYLKFYEIRLPNEIIPEVQIKEWLKSQGFDDFVKTRQILNNNFELDLYSDSLKIAIEHCGLYWHSKTKKGTKYHRNKYLECKKLGIRLITIFEDEWMFKRDIIEKRLLHLLKKSGKSIGARLLTIKEIDANKSSMFLNSNHINGNAISAIKFGAFDTDNNLKAVMSFRKKTKKDNSRHEFEWSMTRFATDGTNMPGIASKLFSTFIKKIDPKSVLSYSDLRYGEGDYLQNLGFVRVDDTVPGYSYFSENNPDFKKYHREMFQRQELIKLYPEYKDSGLSEYNIAKEVKLEQIYDCGNAVWLWTKI